MRYNYKMINTYALEGIDRLGKSTLIQNLKKELGYFQSIHFTKPPKEIAKVYDEVPQWARFAKDDDYVPVKGYQGDCFYNSMVLAQSGAKIVYDRWHLGEYVYAPMYRGYSGDYIFNLETRSGIDSYEHVRLILLIEDFEKSKHFIDDGESLGTEADRETEQNLFIEAFHKSGIRDKRIICVTDQITGAFRSESDILKEALA